VLVERGIQIGDVSGMMFIVMKMHGGLVDVRLKCIVGIGQGCYFMGHWTFLRGKGAGYEFTAVLQNSPA
jgi:hypothetical protein